MSEEPAATSSLSPWPPQRCGQRAVGDPNFPESGLDIAPSFERFHSAAAASKKHGDSGPESPDAEQRPAPHRTSSWAQDSREDIERFGIAGRVWEAAYVLQRYLTPPSGRNGTVAFDPPCPFFADAKDGTQGKDKVGAIIELGAGVGLVGIHLARMLAATETYHGRVVLTDLDNVLPLLRRNVDRAAVSDEASSRRIHDHVLVRPLPWGSAEHADAVSAELASMSLDITHIVCSDLVYFPALLPPLLRSLVHLTAPSAAVQRGAHVLISYKIRSLPKEEAFWRAFGVWFDFSPVLVRQGKDRWRRFGSMTKDFFFVAEQSDSENRDDESDEGEQGDDEVFVFHAIRRPRTYHYKTPIEDNQLMMGYVFDPASNSVISSTPGSETLELILMSSLQM